MKKISLILLVLATILSSCTAQSSKGGKDISPEEFKTKMSETHIILLDVRTAQEVTQGKIPGSINIDIHDPQFDSKTNAIDKSKTILVYCAVGGRSAKAMNQLANKGYTVYNLTGGVKAWNSKGFEITK